MLCSVFVGFCTVMKISQLALNNINLHVWFLHCVCSLAKIWVPRHLLPREQG